MADRGISAHFNRILSQHCNHTLQLALLPNPLLQRLPTLKPMRTLAKRPPGRIGAGSASTTSIMKSAAEEIDLQEMPEQVLEKVKSAGDHCNTACRRAVDAVKRNPIPAVLGAMVFGAAVGYLIYSRREDITIPDRFAREAEALRRRLRNAPDRLSSLLHDGVERASAGAGKASDFIHGLPANDVIDSITGSLNRTCNRLKFW